MRVPRIYTDSPLTPGDDTLLDAPAAQHVGRALRMQPGQSLVLFNGDGYDYPAELVQVTKSTVTARPGTPVPGQAESPLQVHLGQVLSRGDRMDYAIQKSTELGVASITPLFSDRCEVRLKGDRAEKRQRHWQQVAISAAEQCGRARVPAIQPVTSLSDWFARNGSADLRLVLHHRAEHSLSEWGRPGTLALLIGPEGGLNEAEIETALAHNYHPAALGPRVMRTETAPVAALSVCQWLWGDFAQGP
ncbi:16S rRNA (uracil(1498)-N(3))-methyltransferase [Tamilnaduibacter salinus]|uniref:Ribosomal RNA small subunit methyltransferase E n=1 Tax=Tamilnaduibacter salinus TaxID=1484056 RepID=A0A2A2I5S6_9GAMM|nr:16S rRNA (uracil(1498)-N(3))-methyltransferase [Tamilnaduibacter salinus]PAV26634.1 16S rRNA (uracil(1498)-N(3))-methyltransferase [Tamilnaduibacter salinus]